MLLLLCQKANLYKEVKKMNTEEKKYEFSNMYLKEFSFDNGEYDITFNIVNIDTEKMIIEVAITDLGKIRNVEYDLKRDKDGNLYFEYGCEYSKIEVDSFERIND